MNPVSARALVWISGLLIVLAPAIISPAGTFPLLILAALCSAIPSLFAVKRCRAIALVLLCISLVMLLYYYPDFKQDQEVFRERAKGHAVKPQPKTLMDQGAINN